MLDSPTIKNPYLVCINIPLYQDHQGQEYLDSLWYLDILGHLEYLENFVLACPYRKQGIMGKNDVKLNQQSDSLKGLEIVKLPPLYGLKDTIRSFSVLISQLWQSIGRVDIVHAGVAGWPIPLGWLVVPIALLRRKLLIIIVESAPWRLNTGQKASFKAKLKELIYETLARWCVNQADISFFSQKEYKESLLTRNNHRGHVINATWIDDHNIISEEEAEKSWREKLPSPYLRILFAGRLEINKGILVLLQAMQIIKENQIPVKLDILGTGTLEEECRQIAEQLGDVKLLGTVNYDSSFFELLRKYSVLIIPNISDEQPRIVYDAYSQAVPCLASNTAGLRDCIKHKSTGLLVPINDPVSLAKSIEWSWENLALLKDMGMTSLKLAQRTTHSQMHQQRAKLIREMLEKRDA